MRWKCFPFWFRISEIQRNTHLLHIFTNKTNEFDILSVEFNASNYVMQNWIWCKNEAMIKTFFDTKTYKWIRRTLEYACSAITNIQWSWVAIQKHR